MTTTLKNQAQTYLETMLGPGSYFRDGQWEAIETIAVHRRRALVVQRTGWGKSIVYFLATKLLREQGAGPYIANQPIALLNAQSDHHGRADWHPGQHNPQR